ncbi:hypothetical protein J3B02_003241 [Coemansia erecta]|uniref:Mediator of RNA polymerase II transcription subunit 17 n=1 Tax=Coemansia asiatica TaxID=1052880 RepID=A0A9W7XM11_9FUNG|nr:hypothetical protein LPJ64_002214 [Coemansia asiatica]KAJ2853228.1 hypothetical protein J3B02_003241 [Coemansia erecta]KAJ2880951.1 hypothetical protein FB639_002718 [Coemansia asiatica]
MSFNLTAPVESTETKFTVTEIDDQGAAVLLAPPTVKDKLTLQIGQLWQAHNNFSGLSEADLSSDTNSEDTDTEQKAPATSVHTEEAELDAYAVRAKVHDALTLAQSEIQVSLDIVRLLLAAKKQAARDVGQSAFSGFLKHDQPMNTMPVGPSFNALVGGDSATEVLVGGLPFAVGVLDTMRTEARADSDGARFVLGAKHKQLHEAADTLESSAERLRNMVSGEKGFWRTAFGLRKKGWVVQHQVQAFGRAAWGDRYFVKLGYTDCGSSFGESELAELLRNDIGDDSSYGEGDSESGIDSQGSGLVLPTADCRRAAVRLLTTEGSAARERFVAGAPLRLRAARDLGGRLESTHRRLTAARDALFDRELYHRLCREARALELGSMRGVANGNGNGCGSGSGIRDVLAVPLSRDNVSVQLQWAMDLAHGDEKDAAPRDFATWQSRFYARTALTMAGLYQRRQHRATKAYFLGDGLSSRTLLSNSLTTVAAGSARGYPPEALVSSIAADAAAGSDASAAATVVVSRPELLLLAPVLQALQFAKWQHLLTAITQRAVAAWRRLVDEPIEVITHFGRTYRTPGHEQRAAGAMTTEEMREWQQFYSGRPPLSKSSMRRSGGETICTAYLIRMRFPGGTVMAIRLDSSGTLFFAKGYFPPPVPIMPAPEEPAAADSSDENSSDNRGDGSRAGVVVGPWPEQKLIHRVFRIVPLSGLSEFTDQLQRELQSLVLLRVAAALSKCSYRRVDKQCQMGQWYVHQSQGCVVGEWWQGARHRQIIGVAKWSASAMGDGGVGDQGETWNLALYFGPKHPTVFDIPESPSLGSRVPWTTCYPNSGFAKKYHNFEDSLFDLLVSTF